MRAIDSDRRELLQSLLNMERSISEISTKLAEYPWDDCGKCVVLTRAQLIRVLERFAGGGIESGTVEQWANAIESREDIDFESGFEDLIGEVVHELANPLLTQLLEPDRASSLVAALKQHDR